MRSASLPPPEMTSVAPTFDGGTRVPLELGPGHELVGAVFERAARAERRGEAAVVVGAHERSRESARVARRGAGQLARRLLVQLGLLLCAVGGLARLVVYVTSGRLRVVRRWESVLRRHGCRAATEHAHYADEGEHRRRAGFPKRSHQPTRRRSHCRILVIVASSRRIHGETHVQLGCRRAARLVARAVRPRPPIPGCLVVGLDCSAAACLPQKTHDESLR